MLIYANDADTRTITRQNILEQYFEKNNNTFIHTLQCHHHCP